MSKIIDTEEFKNLYKSEYKFGSAIEWILDGYKKMSDKIAKLEKQISSLSNVKPGQKLLDYAPFPEVWVSSSYQSYGDVKSNYYNYGYSEKNVRPVTTEEDINNYLKTNEPIYLQNVEICKINLAAFETARALFLKLGLSESKYDYVGRRKNKERVPCSWTSELRAQFICSCDYDWKQLKERAIKEIAGIKKYNLEMEQQKAAAEQAKEKATKEQFRIALIVNLISKYKLQCSSPIPEKEEVIEQLIKQNKYLYLAHRLNANRNDWNDGFILARDGVEFFVAQKEDSSTGPLDACIYENITSHFSGFDDGRVFRDCEWNYNRLFVLVSEQNKDLFDDYGKLVNL